MPILSIDDCTLTSNSIQLSRYILLGGLPNSQDPSFCDHDRYHCSEGEIYVDCSYQAVFTSDVGILVYGLNRRSSTAYSRKLDRFTSFDDEPIQERAQKLVDWVNEMARLHGEEHFPTPQEYLEISARIWGRK